MKTTGIRAEFLVARLARQRFFTKIHQRSLDLRVYKGEDAFVSGHYETGTSDVERLVEASRMGDRCAFDQLVRMYQRRTMHLAVRLLGNLDEATEVVQQAFVTAYLKIGKLRDPKRFESWLLKIVTNLAIDHREAARHRLGAVEAVDCEAGGTASPVENQIKTELEEAIQRAMLRLSHKEAKAISLFGFEGLSHKDVARIMGCSVGTARWYVFCARRKLSALLKDYL